MKITIHGEVDRVLDVDVLAYSQLQDGASYEVHVDAEPGLPVSHLLASLYLMEQHMRRLCVPVGEE